MFFEVVNLAFFKKTTESFSRLEISALMNISPCLVLEFQIKAFPLTLL